MVRQGPLLTTASLVRGAWELRFIRVVRHDGQDLAGESLRVSGWPISGDAPIADVSSGRAVAASGTLTSVMRAITGFTAAGVQVDDGATFLGPTSATPWLSAPVLDGDHWVAAAIGLAGDALETAPTAAVEDDVATVHVVWDDGARVSVTLPEVIRAPASPTP